MRVTVIAHASVLIEVGDQCILIDPIFDDVFGSGTLCFNPARTIDTERLIARVTALVVTHGHLDHFHPPTLQLFGRDLPVAVPPDQGLLQSLRSLGFDQLVVLSPWRRHRLGEVELVATPSEFEDEEFGLFVRHRDDSYWHMSDAIVTEAIGRRVGTELGPVSLCAVKYQPLRTLIAYQRGVQSAMLDRDELVDNFEAACAAEPATMFPYFSGFAFHGRHAWANRQVCPYSAAEVARLLGRRVEGRADVLTVKPGDVLDVDTRSVTKRVAASDFVAPCTSEPVQRWEPIDPSTLTGVDTPAERVWLTLELRRLLETEVLRWVREHLSRRTGVFDAFRELNALWQCTVHLGDGQRLVHAVDFRGPELVLYPDTLHPDANVFSHVSGLDLWQVVRGEVGAEVFWMAGGYRIYEKLLWVEDGRLCAPAVQGWALFERLPDPLTHFLRKVGHRRRQAPRE